MKRGEGAPARKSRIMKFHSFNKPAFDQDQLSQLAGENLENNNGYSS